MIVYEKHRAWSNISNWASTNENISFVMNSCQLALHTRLTLNPVLCLQAQLRTKGAGLGTKGSSYSLSASDTYKDAVRKAMFARFTEIE